MGLTPPLRQCKKTEVLLREKNLVQFSKKIGRGVKFMLFVVKLVLLQFMHFFRKSVLLQFARFCVEKSEQKISYVDKNDKYEVW